VKIFHLPQFGIDVPWLHLSCVGGWQEVVSLTPSVTCIEWLCWWQACSWCSSPINRIGFCYQNEWEMYIISCSPIKHLWKTISIEKKLDITSRLEKGKQIL